MTGKLILRFRPKEYLHYLEKDNRNDIVKAAGFYAESFKNSLKDGEFLEAELVLPDGEKLLV